jgi:hypothetical protein
VQRERAFEVVLGGRVGCRERVAAGEQRVDPRPPQDRGPAREQLQRLRGVLGAAQPDGRLDLRRHAPDDRGEVPARPARHRLQPVEADLDAAAPEIQQRQPGLRPRPSRQRAHRRAPVEGGELGVLAAPVLVALHRGQVGQRARGVAHPERLAGVAGDRHRLATADPRLAVPAEHDLRERGDAQPARQRVHRAVLARLRDERGREVDALLVARRDERPAGDLEESARTGGRARLVGPGEHGVQRRETGGIAVQYERGGPPREPRHAHQRPVGVEAEGVEPVDAGGDQLLVGRRRPRRVQGLHEHPEGALGIVPRDAQRGVGEQAVRPAQLPLREVSACPHRGQPGEHGRITDVPGGALRQAPRPLQPAAVHPRLAGQHEPARGGLPVDAQRGRTLVGGRRRGVATPGLRPVGRLFEVGGHPLVGAGGGECQVPGPPVDVVGVCLGEGGVHRDALHQGRTVVDGRADQRVAEGQAVRRDGHEPAGLGRLQVRHAEAEGACRQQEGRDVPGVVGRGHEQHLPAPRRERPDLVVEGVEHPARQRDHADVGALRRDQRGQLPQRERVAVGLGDQPFPLVGG